MSKYKKANQKKSGEMTEGENSFWFFSTENKITGIWVVLILSLFPVIVTNGYFNILETKFTTYSILTGLMLLSLLIWGFASKRLTGYRFQKNNFDAADKWLFLFFGIACISTLTAYPYIQQAFSGVEGRYTGLFLLALYFFAYLCVTRFYRFRKMDLTIFLWAGLFICIFGITDYFKMDIMGFKANVRPKQLAMFTSTIGNINTYTTFVGFSIALAGTLFILSKEKKSRLVFYLICLFVAFEAIVMGNSDNGYLTLAAFFGFLPFIAFRTRQGVRRYFLSMAGFFSVIRYVQVITDQKGSAVLGINGLFDVISMWKYLNVLIAVLWVITVFLFVIDYKTGAMDAPAPKWIRILWYVFFGSVAAAVLYGIVKANSITMEEATAKFGGLANYLKFTDAWGTNRGAVWIEAVKDYQLLSPIHKIFGTGPDTFGIYMINMSRAILSQKTGQIYDSAHNEYLQYLFTIGPIGLTAYIGFLVTSVRKAFRKADIISGVKLPSAKDRYDVSGLQKEYAPYLTAFAMLIICYAAQAVVNINLPISTPILWTFLMMAGAVGRKKAK